MKTRREHATARTMGGPSGAWGWLTIVGVTAFSLLVRRLTLQDLEIGGDALQRWFFVRQWSWSNDFSALPWNHHMGRSGVNVWVYLSQLLFGHEPGVCYVAPVFAATVQSVATFALARRVAGPWAGLVAALLVVAFPPMGRAGSQLLPGVFSGMYVALACYAFVLYCEATGARWRQVAAMACLLFAAYLSKVPNVFFIPGFVISVWLAHREKRDIALLLGLLAAMLAVETAVYFTTTPHWSRLDVVLSSHLSGKGPTLSAKAHLLDRYTKLPRDWQMLFFAFLPAWVGSLALTRDRRIQGLCWIAFGFLLFKTFAVRSLAPVRLLERFHPRYLIVLVPLMATTLGVFCSLSGSALVRRCKPVRHSRWLSSAAFTTVVSLLVLLAASWRPWKTRSAWAFERGLPGSLLASRARAFRSAYAAGIPIVEKTDRRNKALRAVWQFYLPDELLVQDGFLPRELGSIEKPKAKEWWLRRAELQGTPVPHARRCWLTVSKRGRILTMYPRGGLRKGCLPDAPKAAKAGRTLPR